MNRNESSRGSDDAPDDPELTRLLGSIGMRDRPSPEMAARIRAAVADEWRATVERRRRSRHYSWAAAAGLAFVAVGASLLWMRASPAVPVASLVRVSGEAMVRRDGRGSWVALRQGDEIRAGDIVRTSGDGRLALKLDNGVDLRQDRDTSLEWSSATAARLASGAVFVDSGAGDGATREFSLETPMGAVRHVGTRYQVRVRGAAIDVAVREGRVRVDGRAGAITGKAGEWLTVHRGGVERRPLATTSDEWDWTSDIAPAFEIDGRTLHEFLAWAGRETGRDVAYATPAIAETAKGMVLHGSIDGLSPEEALGAVLTTTSLAWSLDDGRISLNRVEPAESPIG